MKFVVTAGPAHTAPIPGTLRAVTPIPESEAVEHRDLELRKMATPGGCQTSMWAINGLMWDDVTEFPVLGSTEVWRFINRSGVMHPMHMHLVMFQVLDSHAFTVSNDSIIPVGPLVPPPPQQSGWKDTAPVPPDSMVRVIARFEDYVGRYAYHCHILEHEDHEMMRQFQVVHAPVTDVEGTAPRYTLALHTAMPNPFNPTTRIDYEIPRRAFARLDIFDVQGRLVTTLARGVLRAGPHHVVWDGRDHRGASVASGLYAYRPIVDGERPPSRKMILMK
jgi:hypothetical protein